MSSKQRALVICPGRGCYNKDQLGYLAQFHQNKTAMIDTIDSYRQSLGYSGVSELDAMERYSINAHTRGENASALIYACAMGDNQAIDLNQYDICAVTGNSMGWYIALAVAQAVSPQHAIELVTTMGSMMEKKLIGGQLIYPVTDEQWQALPKMREQALQLVATINQQVNHQLYLSIDLGAFLVIAGDAAGLKAFEQQIPKIDKYPMRLLNHGAFHTPMLKEIAEQAQQQISPSTFNKPVVPLIDGMGKIWSPYATDTKQLHQYTLDTQVCEPYYFDKAIDVAIKEFAPDVLIVLGPGNSLSSSVAQRLIEMKWQGISSKSEFIARQKNNPIIIAMGMPDQRQLVTIN